MSKSDTQTDIVAIRGLISEWQSALRAKDLDQLTAHYSPDVVFFDVVPPFQRRGIAAYRESWEQCLPLLPASLGTEDRELQITVSGDVAFAHGFTRLTDLDTGEAATCGWVRATLCYQRQEGQWRVVHEHVSLPFDPATGRVTPALGALP